ncbi:hypothetical protein HGRIS_007345 [Hohenbuehelia grisea]|uniref:Uncharacterized protein n=1 Tax=Hohenbuehelia grisea TaxID=104357 RepID=A0ABR3J4V6_9AGAR
MTRLEKETNVEDFDDFGTRLRASASRLNAALSVRYPGLDPVKLPLLSRTKRLLLREPVSPHLSEGLLRLIIFGSPFASSERLPGQARLPLQPAAEVVSPYLLMRFNNIINKATARRLLNCYVEMEALGLKTSHAEAHWSTTSALHAGVWSLYQKMPYVTRDTRSQPSAVTEVLARMLGIIAKEVAPKLVKLLKEHCPEQWARLQRAYDRVKTIMWEVYGEKPWLDFEGAFFTVAVKQGSSKILHLDWNDDKCGGITWVIPVGRWEGGEFCSPQLKACIPVAQGQALGVQARRLVHCGAPAKGTRVVFMLFADHTLLKQAEQ